MTRIGMVVGATAILIAAAFGVGRADSGKEPEVVQVGSHYTREVRVVQVGPYYTVPAR